LKNHSVDNLPREDKKILPKLYSHIRTIGTYICVEITWFSGNENNISFSKCSAFPRYLLQLHSTGFLRLRFYLTFLQT